MLSAGLAVLASSASVGAVDPGIVAEELRRVGIDPEHAVRVEGFRLRAGIATVTLVDGVLVPSTEVSGRAVEFVFLGEGRIELEPPDEVEAGQLELFTGAEVLAERFNRAVFVMALDAASDTLASKPSAPETPVADEAAGRRRARAGSSPMTIRSTLSSWANISSSRRRSGSRSALWWTVCAPSPSR